jgi:CheY-like chemotaxis protein
MLVAKLILNKHNIYPDEAINGLEAIKKLQSTTPYDIIFMDIQMPEMDGLEATQYIRKQLNLSLPIIALTANAVKEELDYYISEGLNDYITKPFEEKTYYRNWHNGPLNLKILIYNML